MKNMWMDNFIGCHLPSIRRKCQMCITRNIVYLPRNEGVEKLVRFKKCKWMMGMEEMFTFGLTNG